MVSSKRKIVLVLFLFSVFLRPLGAIENAFIDDETLKEEILGLYSTQKEIGLREFVHKKGAVLTHKFLVGMAWSCARQKQAEWLKVCEILATEKADEKTLADVWFCMGQYYSLMADHSNDKGYFDKALNLYQKLNHLEGQADVWFQKGLKFSKEGDLNTALEWFGRALELYEKAAHLPGQLMVQQAMVKTYDATGQTERKLEHVARVNILNQKATAISGQGESCLKKASIYAQMGSLSEAIAMYDKALPFFEKAGNTRQLLTVLEAKGNQYTALGDNTQSFLAYQEALYVAEKNDHKDFQGSILRDIGDVYYQMDNYGKAIKMYNRAMIIFKDSGDLLGQAYVNIKISHINNNTANLTRDDILTKAKQSAQDNEDSLKKQNNPLTNMSREERKHYWEESHNYQALAQEYLFQGQDYEGLLQNSSSPDYKNAMVMYEKALKYFKKASDLVGQGSVYLYQGDICFNTSQYGRALRYYDQALQLAEKTRDMTVLSSIQGGKAHVYEKMGQLEKAIQQYDILLSFHQKLQDLQWESMTLFDKALLLKELGRKDEALDCFEKSITRLDQFRQQTAFSQLKKGFFNRFYLKYEEVALFMLENRYYQNAFKLVESMKARLFLDQLTEGITPLTKGISETFRIKRDVLTAELPKRNREIAQEKDPEKLKVLINEYQQKENELDDLLIQIRLENPVYATIQYPQPITVARIQKDLLKEEEIILRYFVTSQKVFVFLISKENFQVVTLDVTRGQIEKMVKNYKDCCYHEILNRVTERDANIRLVGRWLSNFGNECYQSLFQPFEAELKGKKELIIVPDGNLASLPFESFVSETNDAGKPVYLLEKYPFKYIQSASVLQLIRSSNSSDSQIKSFIGFADPVYDYESFKQKKGEYVSHDVERSEENKGMTGTDAHTPIWKRLKGSREEVEAIARLFPQPTQNTVIHLQADATEENAKLPCLKAFDCIHFSCHGVLADGYQGLVLSQIPDAKEDGYLTLNEIMNCEYHAKLVVLSACETGLGKEEIGEGITGLTRAVMYAGTPAVVVSLWSVDEDGTKELLVKFYTKLLQKGLGQDEALRQAKLEMIKDDKTSSPYLWSAFVMYGE